MQYIVISIVSIFALYFVWRIGTNVYMLLRYGLVRAQWVSYRPFGNGYQVIADIWASVVDLNNGDHDDDQIHCKVTFVYKERVKVYEGTEKILRRGLIRRSIL